MKSALAINALRRTALLNRERHSDFFEACPPAVTSAVALSPASRHRPTSAIAGEFAAGMNATTRLLAALALIAAAGPASSGNGPDFDLQSVCPSVYQPVCAGKARETRSFGNACLAQREGFSVISRGACGGSGGLPRFCTKQYDPVCGEKNGERKVFGNACEARAEDFAVVHEGQC
jgi:hypothetical protein